MKFTSANTITVVVETGLRVPNEPIVVVWDEWAELQRACRAYEWVGSTEDE